MDDPGLAKELVDALVSGFPDSKPSLRPVHTWGVGATGSFVASDVAREYCKAEHFLGGPVKVTVRFSNGSGSSVQHDGWSDVRGLATRFHLVDGSATDLLAMTLPVFFTPTIDTFFKFSDATKPVRIAREAPWLKILDMLRLINPQDNPPPGQTTSPNPGAEKFADGYDRSKLPVFLGSQLGAPVSYVRATYHAVHTFIVTARDGTRRWVRFTWQPVSGVLKNDPSEAPVDNYLPEELRKRVAKDPKDPPRFTLMMSIGEAGDDFKDPARPWPPRRVRVAMGTMTIDAVPEDQVANCERLSFNPMRLVDGIEASDDPILRARLGAYEYSRERRGGTACPFSRS